MADEKISALPSAGTLDGTEPVPIVQSGTTKQTTTQDIANLASSGTTLTPDQVDAIDNANSPDAGNPFATMSDIVSGVVYQGAWNASTNSPALTSSVGTQGYYYVVSVAGTTDLDGITDWQVGDWVIFNGSVWQKVDNTDNPTVWGSITGNILDQADVGARKDNQGNTFIGTNNTTNSITTSTDNTFQTYADGNTLLDSSKCMIGVNSTNNNLNACQNIILGQYSSNNSLTDCEITELGVSAAYCELENCSGVSIGVSGNTIKLLNSTSCNFGNSVTNFDIVVFGGASAFTFCTVASNLDFATVDFTSAAQLFARTSAWSINKVLGTNLIEVTFDSGLPTSQTGQYDTSTDTFTPNPTYASKPLTQVGGGTTVTGTTSNTYSNGLLVPAGSKGANDIPRLLVRANKTGSGGTLTLRVYLNNTNNLSGSPILMGTYQAAAATRTFGFMRNPVIEVAGGTGNGTQLVDPTLITLVNDAAVANNALSAVALDWVTVPKYIVTAVQLSNTGDSGTVQSILLD